jgi:hypothetical protein
MSISDDLTNPIPLLKDTRIRCSKQFTRQTFWVWNESRPAANYASGSAMDGCPRRVISREMALAPALVRDEQATLANPLSADVNDGVLPTNLLSGPEREPNGFELSNSKFRKSQQPNGIKR